MGLHKFRMDWCFIFNGLYEGSIAAAIHATISGLSYIGICFCVIRYASHFSGPEGVALGNEYREVMIHGRELFRVGHTESRDDEPVVHTFAEARQWVNRKLHKKIHQDISAMEDVSTVPNWVQRIILDVKRIHADSGDESIPVDEHATEEPLLTDAERDLFIVPSNWMLVISTLHAGLSLLLFIAVHKKISAILLLWTAIVLPLFFITDNVYQIYLFYLLLNLEPLWAHTGSVWFEIFIVLNFILWIVRDLCNLYSFFGITAYRNTPKTKKQRKRRRSSVVGASVERVTKVEALTTALICEPGPARRETSMITSENNVYENLRTVDALNDSSESAIIVNNNCHHIGYGSTIVNNDDDNMSLGSSSSPWHKRKDAFIFHEEEI